MVKNKPYKMLIIVLVVCLSFICAIAVLNGVSKDDDFRNGVSKDDDFSEAIFSESDFPLELDLNSTVFNVGGKISGTVTITNRSGKDVTVVSNGAMPCTYLRNTNDNTSRHVERSGIAQQILKIDHKMSKNFEWIAKESGTYVLYVHYCIEVNGVIVIAT